MQFQLILAGTLWIHGRIRQEQRDKKKGGSVADWLGESCLAWNGPVLPDLQINLVSVMGSHTWGPFRSWRPPAAGGQVTDRRCFLGSMRPFFPWEATSLWLSCEGWKLARPAQCRTLPKVTLAWGHPSGLAKTQSEMHCNLTLPVPFFFPLSFHRGQTYLRLIPVLFPFTAVCYQ